MFSEISIRNLKNSVSNSTKIGLLTHLLKGACGLSSDVFNCITLSFLWFVLAALQSIFPQAELGTFLSLSKKEKENQLKELSMIVTGIRLFNRETGKGGEGIEYRRYILRLIPRVMQV